MVDKQKILARVLKSSDLKGSKRYQELLKYLVKASEKNEFLKESTIATDVFDKDSSFNPNEDPTIRVYISNLRKKLEHYYLTDGKDDEVRIKIPKGHYYLEFVKIDKGRSLKKYKYLTFFFFLPLIFISTIIIIYLLILKDNGYQEEIFTDEHPIWGEFLQNNEDPTLLVLGDYFFLYENKKDTKGGYFVRDPRINSPDELKQVLKDNPSLIKRFVESNFTYLGPSSAESMTYILPILINSPNRIFVKLSSQFKLADIDNHNIIFVGSFKALFDLRELLLSTPLKYQIFPPTIYLTNEKADTTKVFHAMSTERVKYKKDYGLILKQLSPENHTLLFLMGFDELGIIEAVKRITDPQFTNSISDLFDVQIPSQTFSFTSIIEVEGIDRSTYNSKIVYFGGID